ncbi:MAG: glycerophosphodiester phosphodiesterase family protein [Bacilli bacterium]|jgi:glycerophosphoryl diester phosphodiesterase
MNDFTNFLKIPLAHRGLHDARLDENSLGAFKEAVKHGYGIELDVHLMKDGGLAVVHDNHLGRVANLDINVSDLTIEDLQKTSLIISKEPIPTLKEVLEVVNGKVPLLIEIKVDGGFNPALPAKIIELLKDYPDTNMIAIESFNPYALRWLRKNHPRRYPYGQLISHNFEGVKTFTNLMFETMGINLISRPYFISFDINYLPNKKVRRLYKRGKPIISWTINTVEKQALAKRETANYIFEKIRP